MPPPKNSIAKFYAWCRRLTLKWRFICAGIGLLLLVIPGSFSVWSILHGTQEYQHLLSHIEESEEGALFVMHSMNLALVPGQQRETASATFSKGAAAVEANLDGLSNDSLLLSSDQLELKKLQSLFQNFVAAFNPTLSEMREGKDMSPAEQAAIRNLSLQGDRFVQALEVFSGELQLRAKESVDAEISQVLWILLASVLGGVVIFVLLYHGVIRPVTQLQRLKAMMLQVRKHGDLTVQWDVSSSRELDELALQFNDLIVSLRGSVGESARTVAQVAANGGQLARIISTASSGLAEQQRETDIIAEAIEGVAATAQRIVDNTALAAEAARDAEAEAASGVGQVEASNEAVSGLVAEVREVATVVTELNAQSDAIGDVAELIADIADQTNLLALNAAIEAARAGEAGRGFAVVADEVRSLAQRTRNSTSQIHAIIQELHDKTRFAITRVETSLTAADRCVALAEEAGASLDRIKQGVSAITRMNAEIATDTEAQGRSTQDIRQHIAKISEIGNVTAQTTAIVATVGNEMLALTNQLETYLGRFHQTTEGEDEERIVGGDTELF